MINTLDYLLSQPCSALNEGTFSPMIDLLPIKSKAALKAAFITCIRNTSLLGNETAENNDK